MIIGFQTPAEYVYHYTRLRIAADHMLANRTLKIGCFTSTNDPKESKDWEFSLFAQNLDRHFDADTKSLSGKLSNALKSRTKVVCFSQDDKPLSGDHIRDIFLRGWSKPRMWAQYSDNHSGVCLVFDRQALDQAIAKKCGGDAIVLSGEVSYVNRSIVPTFGPGAYVIDCDRLTQLGFDSYAKDHLQRFYRPLFLEKMSDWEHETEFRWVVFSQLEDDIFVEITSSLRGVVFGDRCPDASIDALIDMTEDLSLDYMGLKWRNCSPWYDFGAFRYDRTFRHLRKQGQHQ